MRELVYVFANGSETKSYPQAKATGEPFKAVVRNIKLEKSKLSPKRAAMLEKFGFVSAKFKDLV